MRKLSTRQMRAELPRLEELLAAEGEVVLTRRGKPIARLRPIAEGGARPSHARLRRRMAPLARGSEVLVREDRDGR